MRMAWGLLAGVVCLGTVARADTPTLQADFDAATKAYEENRCQDAEPIFARLAASPKVKPGSLPAAMIALRRGLCHIRTGDTAQGEVWVRAGLPVVEAAGAGMAYDAQLGWMAVGRLAMRRYDHDGAVAAFDHALALPAQERRIEAMLALAMTTAFDGDGAALATIDRALAALAARGKDSGGPKEEGYVRSIRAQILMNLGRYAEAEKEGEKALSLAGGLTDRVTLEDVSLRSDVAEAALLTGKTDRARELLAYTGAGRIAQSPFAAATRMEVPECDDTVGLRPQDNAVVEFSIADDGSVGEAQTMFTRGTYATAAAFAEAVRHWAWQPETVARLPPFYRQLVRVELRCSNAGGPMPNVESPLNQRIARWADPLLGTVVAPVAHIGDVLRERAGPIEAAGDRVGAGVVLLRALTAMAVVPPTAAADADHAVALLDASDPAHRATAAAVRALVAARRARVQGIVSGHSMATANAAALIAAARQPVIAADALAADTLLMKALVERGLGRFSDADIAILHEVADDARLGTAGDPGAPLRQIALLRLASLAASQGEHAQAEALFARTGLGEEQCGLIGDIPRLRSNQFDSSFPNEALRYGFEGWVREEFDIAADGHTAQQRAVIAYPPFVFVSGATQIAQALRYDPSFRPSGKLACSAKTEIVKFSIPENH
jgi:tetratricopeptide (TPR) repeat protein